MTEDQGYNLEPLGWLIWMEAAYKVWQSGCWQEGIGGTSRLAWYNMLYGPHVGEH